MPNTMPSTCFDHLVSVIMPCYNAARFVESAIRSVLQQDYTEWELLVVDDCSKDDTAARVQAMAKDEPRIRFFQLEHNAGAAAARNKALREAKGRYIAFLDSDDLWLSEKLSRQLAFMKQHDYAFTYSDYQLMDEEGTLTGKRMHMPRRLSYHGYLFNTAIGCLTVVIDRVKTGDFAMPDLRTSQDAATWLLLLKRIPYAYALRECLATYRLVSTSNTASKKKAAKDVWRLYRYHEHLPLLQALFYFCGYAFHAVKKRLF